MIDEEAEFRFLLEKIRRNKGIDFSLYRPATLKRRIRARMHATSCPDYADYVSYLNRTPEEYDSLVEAITINVTEFFRNPETFEYLGKGIIPGILKEKVTQKRNIVRVWSVGTSYGEEAYSVAVLFLEALRGKTSDWDIRIYGTDVDPRCIEDAKRGLYSPKSLKEVPKEMLEKYFLPGEGQYAIREDVKALTRFKQHNLVSDPPLEHLDLVLCRNVVIYFTKALQEMAYSIFARSLNEGGYLVLGKVESLWGYPAQHFEVVNSRERIYQKLRQEHPNEHTGGRGGL